MANLGDEFKGAMGIPKSMWDMSAFGTTPLGGNTPFGNAIFKEQVFKPENVKSIFSNNAQGMIEPQQQQPTNTAVSQPPLSQPTSNIPTYWWETDPASNTNDERGMLINNYKTLKSSVSINPTSDGITQLQSMAAAIQGMPNTRDLMTRRLQSLQGERYADIKRSQGNDIGGLMQDYNRRMDDIRKLLGG